MPFIFLSTRETHHLNGENNFPLKTTLVIYEDGKDLWDFTGDKKKKKTQIPH